MDLDNVARYCLVIGFVITAITTGILFYTSHWTSICIVDALDKKTIDKTELNQCITTPSDIDGMLLIVNVLGITALTYSSAISLRKKPASALNSEHKNDKPFGSQPNMSKLQFLTMKWKEILIIVLIGIITYETVLLLFKLFGIVTFDYDLFKQILIVIIPIIGGALSTFKITNSWQIHTDKIRMKSEILELFDMSIRQKGILIHEFMMDIILTYTKPESDVFDPDTTQSHRDVNFPTDIHEFPKAKFQDKFEKLQKEVTVTTTYNHKFLSKLRLYYRNDCLENRWYDLDKKIVALNRLAHKIVNSTTKDEFIQNANEYDNKRNALNPLLKQFNIDLADGKIRKIPT